VHSLAYKIYYYKEKREIKSREKSGERIEGERVFKRERELIRGEKIKEREMGALLTARKGRGSRPGEAHAG